MSDKAHMHGDRESHRGIVAMKRSNEGVTGHDILNGRVRFSPGDFAAVFPL